MAKAIEQIIDTYVRLDNVRALEDMKAHRHKVIAGARGRTDFDFSLLLTVVDEEIALIDAALKRLQPPPDVAEGTDNGTDDPATEFDDAGQDDIQAAGQDGPR